MVKSLKINKTCFLPPCYSKSGRAADFEEERMGVVKDLDFDIK